MMFKAGDVSLSARGGVQKKRDIGTLPNKHLPMSDPGIEAVAKAPAKVYLVGVAIAMLAGAISQLHSFAMNRERGFDVLVFCIGILASGLTGYCMVEILAIMEHAEWTGVVCAVAGTMGFKGIEWLGAIFKKRAERILGGG